MLLKINQKPDHGFDEPLGLLSDCHRRIEHFLAVLVSITDQVRGGALTTAERGQLEGALTYFATAGPRHTADEEESLFPRLEAAKRRDREVADAIELVWNLEHDHAEANGHHVVVDTIVRRWLNAGTLSGTDVKELEIRLSRLGALYRMHIEAEDRELFPAAARILSAREIEEIGAEMAARRLGFSRTALGQSRAAAKL